MISLFWSLLAAVLAVGAEYLYRTVQGPWWTHLYLWIPIQLTIGFSIYKLVTMPGTPLLGALIMWSFAVIVTRIFVSLVLLHDTVPTGTWVAVGLMTAARLAQSLL